MNFMKRLDCFLGLLLFVIAVCKLEAAPDASQTNIKSFDARGVVRQIANDRRKATIQHEAIVGYMSAMTMDFNVKDTNELNGISPSDEITFKLDIGENESWIEGVHFVSHQIENVTNNTFVFHVPSAELKTGDLLPDCEFTDENGNTVHLSDFRGKAVAFTFFYSRCPLPDYCVRMSKNFSETRQLLLATANAPANWQLLSISFDPEFDSPQMLSNYADFYRGADTNRWLYAAAPTNTLAHLAPQLDLMVMREDGNIMSHNLRTVVLDPQGKIFRQLDGNQWTPQQLADAILAAARKQTDAAAH
jgi:protein SCO1/2